MAVRSDQKRYLKLTPIATALDSLLTHVDPPDVGSALTTDSLGRFSAKDYVAKWDVPRFDVAAMDGYAVRAADLPNEGSPRLFAVRGRISPRHTAVNPLGEGEAYYVATGSPLPPGADTVVRVEETRFVDSDKVSIEVNQRAGKNVSRRGEDLRKGDLIVGRGDRITPSALSVLVYFGVRRVKVYRGPRVGVLSIGDELVDFEATERGGGVYNNYAYLIYSYLKHLGFEPKRFGVVADDPEAIARVVGRALTR
ncbi:MAG: molybdopterin molybdotransferase MoeA, partial [Thermoprotei archaeon]